MSQTSNDAEVENVLSAIRRLIEDGGAGRQPPALGRLVLTPALRVVEPTGPLVLAQAIPTPDPVEAPLDRPPAASEPLVLLNALPPLPSDAEEKAQPIDSGSEEGRAPEPPLATPLPADNSDPSSDPGAHEAALSISPEPEASPATGAPEPADLSLHPEAEGDPLARSPEPEGSPLNDPELADLLSDPGAEEAALSRSAEPNELFATDDPELADLSSDPGADEAMILGAAPLDETASLPMPADEGVPVAEPAQDPVPDEPAQAASGPQSLALPTPDPMPNLDPRTPDEPEPAPPTPSPIAWPDEATLRALVAEALREELRGELGERLTRNLRKLVRREVMQALALREG